MPLAGEGGANARADLVDRSEAVDLDDDAAVLVCGDHRLGLLVVHVLAVPDDLFGVVGTALLVRHA